MTEKPDTTKPFLLRRENRYLWFALILPAYLLVFAWVEAVIPVEECRPTYIPLDDRIPFLEGFIVPYMLWFPMLLALGLDLHQKLLLARRRAQGHTVLRQCWYLGCKLLIHPLLCWAALAWLEQNPADLAVLLVALER